MRIASVLCGLGRQVGSLMDWFHHSGLYRLCGLLWRRLALLWRCIVRYALAPIGWRKEPERIQDAFNSSDDDEDPASSRADQVQRSDSADQHDAEERAAPLSPGPETASRLSGREEGDDEDGEAGKSRKSPVDPGYEEEDDDGDMDKYRVETTDELYCGYDSTWETEDNQKSSFKRTRRQRASRYYKFRRFEDAARDMQNYRHDYPSLQATQQHRMMAENDDKPNLNFYLGNMPSLPDGIYIDTFHKDWFGKYDDLELVHTYIQWLFPLQEPGMNYMASTLTKEEIEEFLQSSKARKNLLESYKLMLNFYGIVLCNEETGEVKKTSNWRDRFENLDVRTHNNLRITRILKCLGNLGYTHYQAPLVHFFLEQTLIYGELPNVKDSVLNYFLFAVRDKRQRRRLLKYAYLNYDRKDEFVWCPKKIQMIWSR